MNTFFQVTSENKVFRWRPSPGDLNRARNLVFFPKCMCLTNSHLERLSVLQPLRRYGATCGNFDGFRFIQGNVYLGHAGTVTRPTPLPPLHCRGARGNAARGYAFNCVLWTKYRITRFKKISTMVTFYFEFELVHRSLLCA